MNPTSILLVDDATDTLEVMAQCLSGDGYHVTCAVGGKEAISLLQDRNFDLVITDLLMPDTDGMEVLMAVRRYQPEARTIAMSGGGEYFPAWQLLNLAKTLGADEQLLNPFSRRDLFDAIDRACDATTALAGAA
jgi:CheY-like chemotaxis protein